MGVNDPSSKVARRFLPSGIYGHDFDIACADYNNLIDWIHVLKPGSERCVNCGFFEPETVAITISIDGACRNNGNRGAQAAFEDYTAVMSPNSFSNTMLITTSANTAGEFTV